MLTSIYHPNLCFFLNWHFKFLFSFPLINIQWYILVSGVLLPFTAKLRGGSIYIYYPPSTFHIPFTLQPILIRVFSSILLNRLSRPNTSTLFKIKKKPFALPFLSSQKHGFLTTASLTTCFPRSHFITLCSKDFFFSFTCQHSGLPNSVLSPAFFSHYSTPLGEFI